MTAKQSASAAASAWSDGDGDAQRPGPRSHDVDRLRQHVGSHVQGRARLLAHAPAQRHAFRRGGRFVEHRGIGDRHRGKVADHRLEIDQRLEPSLRDFRLVGCIRGVPGRILEDVAQYHARCVGPVVALPDVGRVDAVFRRETAQLLERFLLAFRRRQRERLAASYRRRDDRVDQRASRGEAERAQHRRLVDVVGADMPVDEAAVLFELAQAQARARVARRSGFVHSHCFVLRSIRIHPRPRCSRLRRAAWPRRRDWRASAGTASCRRRRR